MITCPQCGKENADNFNYCLECGAELVPRQPAAETQPTGTEQAVPPADEDFQEVGEDFVEPIPLTEVKSPPPREQGQEPGSSGPGAGEPPPKIRACPVCGNHVPEGFRFCGKCGAPINDAGTSPQAAPASEPAGPMGYLVLIEPDGSEGGQYPLEQGETVCGRMEGKILFLEDEYLSPKHAVFTFENGKLVVQDAGSLNGIFFRIQGEVVIEQGDSFRIGKQFLKFEDLSRLEVVASPDEGDDTVLWGSPVGDMWGRVVQIIEGGHRGNVYLLNKDEVVLGREKGDITFPYDGFVSGKHAKLSNRGGNFILTDLGSSNGTFIRLRKPKELKQNDLLLVGQQLLRVDLKG
ncbi:MAG: FHA domain-containing protein [Deltaproteobacteria bacterium]|nr:FHA domain-containing protein [Deltaproteobacteria bacterium]